MGPTRRTALRRPGISRAAGFSDGDFRPPHGKTDPARRNEASSAFSRSIIPVDRDCFCANRSLCGTFGDLVGRSARGFRYRHGRRLGSGTGLRDRHFRRDAAFHAQHGRGGFFSFAANDRSCLDHSRSGARGGRMVPRREQDPAFARISGVCSRILPASWRPLNSVDTLAHAEDVKCRGRRVRASSVLLPQQRGRAHPGWIAAL